MDCPRCKSPLIVVEYQDIELDWCPACEGLWFDSGEMELVTARMRGSSVMQLPQHKATTTEKRLKCPECNKTMEKRLLGDAHPVVADICPLCGGLWLDRGELEQLVGQHAATVGTSPVIEHLRETFFHPGDSHVAAPDTGDGRRK